MKKSYFITAPIRPRAKERTTIVWTQDWVDFVSFVLKKAHRFPKSWRFFWRNKEITLEKLLKKSETKSFEEAVML